VVFFTAKPLSQSAVHHVIFVRPRPHQQQCRSNKLHCRSNIRLCCHKRQQCRTILLYNFVFSTKSKQIEHVQFVYDFVERTKFRSTLLPKPATLLPKRQQCRSNIRHCRKNRSACSIRQCCFDIVASVDRALSPVHTSNIVEAAGNFVACCFDNVAEATFDFVERTKFQRKTRSTLLPFLAIKSNVASTLLPKTATLSKQHSTL